MNLDRNTIIEKAAELSRDYNSVVVLLDESEQQRLIKTWLNELNLLYRYSCINLIN